MLYSMITLLALAAAGAQAQNDDCVGESNGVTYDFCGRVAVFNVYWTNVPNAVDPALSQTNILFEAPDNGWHSFGFSSQQAAGTAMLGANVIFGCDDFDPAVLPAGVSTSPWDTLIGPGPERSVASVAGGFDANNLATLGTITQIRANGICGIRFERLWVSDDLPVEQHIISGTSNGVVFARGPADVPGVHDARAFALEDFLLGQGGISDNPVVLINPVATLPGATTTLPGATTTTPGGTMDGAAAATSVSRLFSVVVAAVAAALW